jgi:glycosyltransferase involved in cell wall biosynthesis
MRLSVCQLCAVDFTLKHFLVPLIDGMQAQGWQVASVCSSGSYIANLREQGYQVHSLPIARGFNPFKHAVTLLRLVRLFHRERFDVLHVHTPIAALLGRIAGYLCGIPMVVYTAHGFYFHDRMHPLPKAVFVFLERLGGTVTDLLFTQSAEDAATAVEKRFLTADRVVAIGNGVDPAKFKPADMEVRARIRDTLGIPADAVVIGMIGRMVSEKGYAEFFTAAAQIAPARPEVFILAIGDRLPSDHAGSIDQPLDAARVTLGPRLILTGLRSDIPDLLAAIDIFTLPSYREGMPRTIIEAMMMALPVVATDIRGSREEVVDGETGLLVPVRDASALAAALQTLVDAPDARARMGRAGRARALALFDESRVIARQIAEIRARLPAGLRERA